MKKISHMKNLSNIFINYIVFFMWEKPSIVANFLTKLDGMSKLNNLNPRRSYYLQIPHLFGICLFCWNWKLFTKSTVDKGKC